MSYIDIPFSIHIYENFYYRRLRVSLPLVRSQDLGQDKDRVASSTPLTNRKIFKPLMTSCARDLYPSKTV